MPQNKNLTPVDLPMTLRFNEEPTTDFLNDLDALQIELVDHPTAEQMRDVAWRYVKATWADDHRTTDPTDISQAELSENLEDVLNFRALPTPMEIFSFTFKFAVSTFRLSLILFATALVHGQLSAQEIDFFIMNHV